VAVARRSAPLLNVSWIDQLNFKPRSDSALYGQLLRHSGLLWGRNILAFAVGLKLETLGSARGNETCVNSSGALQSAYLKKVPPLKMNYIL
jgi:hypothetical protein